MGCGHGEEGQEAYGDSCLWEPRLGCAIFALLSAFCLFSMVFILMIGFGLALGFVDCALELMNC